MEGVGGAHASDGIASHGLSVFNELKYKKGFKHFDYANPDAPKGGSIKLGIEGSFNSLNPYVLKGIPAAGLAITFDTLMAKSFDEPYSLYGLIAESVEVPKDRAWIIFNLRKQARFHDGSPLTADDVVFTFNALKKEGHPFYRTYYQQVKKATALSPAKVRFDFGIKDNQELPMIIGEMPILSKAYFSKVKFNTSTLTPILGSGPYRVRNVDVGKRIVFERVRDYWAKDLPTQKGRFNFDQEIVDYYRDSTVAIEAFKAGAYDLRQENISKVWANSYRLKALEDGRMIKEEIRHHNPSGMQGFVYNTRRPLFQDVRIRRALNLAFDFEWSNSHLFYGAYTRTESYFSNSDFASSGLPSAKEIALLQPFKKELPEEIFTTAYQVPKTDGKGYERKNLIEAKQLLEQAGYVVRKGKLVNKKDGLPVSFEILLDSPSFERVAGPFVRRLARLGIDARIRTIDSAQYEKRMQSFDFDMTMTVFPQSLAPGHEQRDFWHSHKVNEAGSRNLAGVRLKSVDALVDKIENAKGKQELMNATKALDRILLFNEYVIPHWHIRHFRLIYWNKFKRPAIAPLYDLGLDTWWLKPQPKLSKKL